LLFLLVLATARRKEVEDNSIPIARSESGVRIPIVSRSHPGLAAPMHARMTHTKPNALIVAHAIPAAPWLPRTSDSAAEDPIRVVNAVISTKVPPKLKEMRSPGPEGSEGGEELAEGHGVITGIVVCVHVWVTLLIQQNHFLWHTVVAMVPQSPPLNAGTSASCLDYAEGQKNIAQVS
jgi:hypothetical protein